MIKEPPYGEKDISGCGLSGLINKDGKRISGKDITTSIACQRDRGNGLGGGFAAYGIYPDYKDFYALHIMFDDKEFITPVEDYLREYCYIEVQETIPTIRTSVIKKHPIFIRYFCSPHRNKFNYYQGPEYEGVTQNDFMVSVVMHINFSLPGSFVVSSGKNMGAFKGVGYPEEISEFFKLEDYKAYIWTAHNRFPTNTPGWWGGAHPFTLLDWSIVHNGEISSYGINKRFIEMHGYKCTLQTDTEVVAYILDYLIRKQKMSFKAACTVLSPPFWEDIEKMPEDEKMATKALRTIYGSAMLNGPFAVLLGHSNGLIGLSDRVKLRPLVCAEKGETVYMSSEESSIIAICPEPDKVWFPHAGDPIIVDLKEGVNS
ncbi:MAG: glutamine amidotransferase family protein [Nitrospinae bacterium]|nr:glutamine amidotransferase family protein [Nitrospinota bacterium]